MIKNILAIGDSFTAGAELINPNRDSWPFLLAKKNNWQVVNQGKGGGSNDRIVRITLEEMQNEYDLVIIAWTSYDRFEVNNIDISIYTSENRPLLDEWKWTKDYYKYGYDAYYSFTRYLRQIILLQSYFKQCNQKYLFCNAMDTPELYLKQDYNTPKYLLDQIDKNYFIGWPNEHMGVWQGDCPKGPGGHPLELGHQRIAEQINEHIRHLSWIS
jgi:hypothetical protein